ncbi:peptide deformylase [Candidatus Odyssella thessalonicensis]|uniref:peptide deformylase n=1 Tax=Candidatus Odyssella thessalonicensis TaxID=84647 RepID=UPI000225A8EB|nr:peptide deformylase [Candidatus Odyssella thessalonicensis]
MLLTILKEPDPRLRVKAKPIEAVTDEIRQLMEDMLETMYHDEGIGLAATQVGSDKRVIVIDLNSGTEEAPEVFYMANPEILWHSEEKSTLKEGCLSVPETRADITRPAHIKVRYLDRDNQAQEIEADGLLATCIQHEVDHLNGVLFIDYLSRLKQEMIHKKLKKLKKFHAL